MGGWEVALRFQRVNDGLGESGDPNSSADGEGDTLLGIWAIKV